MASELKGGEEGANRGEGEEKRVKEKSGRVGNRRTLKRVEAFENRFTDIYITTGGEEGAS